MTESIVARPGEVCALPYSVLQPATSLSWFCSEGSYSSPRRAARRSISSARSLSMLQAAEPQCVVPRELRPEKENLGRVVHPEQQRDQ